MAQILHLDSQPLDAYDPIFRSTVIGIISDFIRKIEKNSTVGDLGLTIFKVVSEALNTLLGVFHLFVFLRVFK